MKAHLTFLASSVLVPLALAAGEAPASPAAPRPAAAKPPAAAEQPVDLTKPTRFLEEDTDRFLTAMRARLRINTRMRGPFGLSQKPGEGPGLVRPDRPKLRALTPFADVVRMVDAVMTTGLTNIVFAGAPPPRSGDAWE